jgi:hypothetical protein
MSSPTGLSTIKKRAILPASEGLMKGVRFDILTMMQTMHAVGLMPTDVYDRERHRLVELMSQQQDWQASALNLEPWVEAGTSRNVDMGRVRFTLTDEVDDSEPSPSFDWRIMIADYLEAAFDADPDTAVSELNHIGIQPKYRENRSGFSNFHHQSEFVLRMISKIQKDSRDMRMELLAEIEKLRAEIQELRGV